MTRIYLSPPHLGPDELELVRDAFASNWLAPIGPHVDAFEREFASTTGVPHAIAARATSPNDSVSEGTAQRSAAA